MDVEPNVVTQIEVVAQRDSEPAGAASGIEHTLVVLEATHSFRDGRQLLADCEEIVAAYLQNLPA